MGCSSKNLGEKRKADYASIVEEYGLLSDKPIDQRVDLLSKDIANVINSFMA